MLIFAACTAVALTSSISQVIQEGYATILEILWRIKRYKYPCKIFKSTKHHSTCIYRVCRSSSLDSDRSLSSEQSTKRHCGSNAELSFLSLSALRPEVSAITLLPNSWSPLQKNNRVKSQQVSWLLCRTACQARRVVTVYSKHDQVSCRSRN